MGTAVTWAKPRGNHIAAAGGEEGVAGGMVPWSRVAPGGHKPWQHQPNPAPVTPCAESCRSWGAPQGFGGATSPVGTCKQGLTCKHARGRR